ncbi:MAG TPA: COX15/CtaA family protein [Myxococcota bacterium]|nr:COX15/CtaA family protein [Myxococcota bacterium]
MTPLPDDARAAARRAGRGAAALALAAWALIVVGALVRAHGAGLSCPDWPLCHGRLVPDFDARIALEWGHRLLAGGLSLGVAALVVAVLRRRALRARFGRSLALVFALLGLQVVLGGLTVLLGLAPWTVTAHLATGNAFALALAWLARDLSDASRSEARVPAKLAPAGVRLVAVTCALVALQLVLGGLVSSHSAGLACATFPLCNADSVAPTLQGPVGLHVLHRLNAYGVAAAFALLAWRLRFAGQSGRLAWTGLRLVFLQIAVGAANVLLRLPVEVTALHSALAAGIVLTAGLLARDALAAARATHQTVATAARERHALGGAR